MDSYEAAVIEAAQDWSDAQEGSKYGPMAHEIRRAEEALTTAVADLQAANDGRWQRPDCEDDVPQGYRTYTIIAKQDWPRTGDHVGFLIGGEWVSDGYVVTDGTCNVMPGATWFRTIRGAKRAVDCLIQARRAPGIGPDDVAEEFWRLMKVHRDLDAREEGR